MFAGIVFATALATPPCWTVYDAALRASALARHPRYISYDEKILITREGRQYISALAHIDYRDDGLARVRDQRFGFEPQLTWHAEPGPPELGPYGDGRDAWLPNAPPYLRSRNMTCESVARAIYKGHPVYDLRFGGVPPTRPSLRELYVDANTDAVWKLVSTGWVNDYSEQRLGRALATFQVELGYAGPYLVVNHVVWDLRYKEYSQPAHYFGEYTMTNYEFPAALGL